MKQPTQNDRVKAWLLEHGSITRDDAVYVMRPGVNRLSERIRELRKPPYSLDISEGHAIPGTRNTKYVLLSKPEAPKGTEYRMVEKDGMRMMRAVEV